MATIEVRGYVNRPEAKESKGGKKYSTFNLGVKQKEKAFGSKPESVTWANFQVTDFNNSSPPAEKAYVTVKGYLKVREYEKDGIKRSSLEVTAKELEVAAPFNDAAEPPAATAPAGGKTPAKEPWDD